MKRQFTSYPLADFYLFKTKLLNFGTRFSNFCFLDNHSYDFDKSYECIAGAGVTRCTATNENTSSFAQLASFQSGDPDWIFGHAGYDLKNEIENLTSLNFDGIQFPEIFFFVPETVFILSKSALEIGVLHGIDADAIFADILNTEPASESSTSLELQRRFAKKDYIETIQKLQNHIAKGDCYEVCFCQEFFAENTQVHPVSIFENLSNLSPNPFSAFYKYEEKYLMCASPERFLKRVNHAIISQPIKGTSKRNNGNGNDQEERRQLELNEKERAENIMIVDLVRNDLSKICTEGSVSVKEYLKIYTFPQVHQMISTISGNLRENISFAEILSATFPMGSMTGAPKKRAMELIEKYERTKRGLFSGTVGYIKPNGDFDLNVVIRSILYNQANNYLSIQAGSAITFKSDPEKEYEECEVKIEAMRKALM